ncbi:family 1 glycosylhydrolase [Skermania sp. ID1734]|uniref:family 1 glycosylhydrolase n=1 Tax=Skermania sp. ID1734 TaxID=2597516 RepID=UPI00117FBCE2|nr:family 1 glycosylhydrolase [Skermania sp. ID1734]TSD94598.1 family 1 glycosylhydrolase [Skermania sp. ID1734]
MRVLLAFVGLIGLLCPATAAAAPPREVTPVGAGFYWGVASSGYQSEGFAPDSNWRRYVDSGHTQDPYLNSVDFLHRYRDDITRAKSMGANVYRISVEWARVQPQAGTWQDADFAFYDNVIAAIHDAGMRPMLTLDHWVFPGWELDRGGWRNANIVTDWLANARRVVDRYARYQPLWVTFNEPAFYIVNELRLGDIGAADAPAMADRIIQAHNSIYDYIHSRQPGAMVTSNSAYATGVNVLADIPIEDRISVRMDYVGLDYYYGSSLQHPPVASADLLSQPLEPDGMYYALRYYARKFPGKPLYVVENGMPTDNGRPRTDGYDRADDLRDTVYWLQRAKADGMNVIGYNYWSLTDNFEWGSYTPRFGLYTVDVLTDPTLRRRPTDAVAAYRDITAHGGVSADYRPTRPPAFCSMVDPPSSCLTPVPR